MLIKTLDFHFRKSNEIFQLDVYPRDTSQPLTTVHFNFPRSFLNGSVLKQLDFDTRDPAGRVERLRDFGGQLYQQIFTPEVARVWSEHKQNHEFVVLCIRIAVEAIELESVAWETLFDGEEFIAAGTKTTISRLPLDVAPQAALPAVPLPLKMLALVSSPLDLPDHSRLQMEREQEILLEAINDPAGQGRLRADFEDEAKLEILESSLETPYQIFHYTGHGMSPESGGGLLLEDARGNSRPTSVAEVLQSLQRGENSLRLVVLSGCQTARTTNSAGFRDMARGLLRRKIPAVIAMQFSISDAGGLKFAESFYTRIATGRTLELASH
ncbi:MAG: CHAT domain-containing protein, partial [Acidobacteriota bacterium]|nr:CHAT domain-containing protein [Acidobacteriota bacterium]